MPYKLALKRARKQRRIFLRQLQKREPVPETLSLHNSLVPCTKTEPCRSGACPVCTTRLQYRLARAVKKQAAKTKQQVFCLTIIPHNSLAKVVKLSGVVFDDHVRRLKRALEKTEIMWLIGGIDFSLNLKKGADGEATWFPHLHAIGAARNLEVVRNQLKASYGSSFAVSKPVMLVQWDGRLNALLYLLKPDFFRREEYLAPEKENPKTGEVRAAHQKTSPQPLRMNETLELRTYLHQIPLSRRIFAYRCQPHIGKLSVKLRMLNGKPM